MSICVKREEDARQCGCEQTENRGLFANKLVMIGPAKNCDFGWVDKSVN